MSYEIYEKILIDREDVCSKCGDLLNDEGDCYSCHSESGNRKSFVFEYAHESISNPRCSIFRKVNAYP